MDALVSHDSVDELGRRQVPALLLGLDRLVRDELQRLAGDDDRNTCLLGRLGQCVGADLVHERAVDVDAVRAHEEDVDRRDRTLGVLVGDELDG